MPVSAVATSGDAVGATRSGTTGSDGCVILGELVAGTYTVSASQPGYVDRAGNPTASQTASVQPKQLWSR